MENVSGLRAGNVDPLGGPDATASGLRRNKRGCSTYTDLYKICSCMISQIGSHLLSLRDPDAWRPGHPTELFRGQCYYHAMFPFISVEF